MNNRLYVGNLPYSTTEDDLKEIFGQVGNVTSARGITDQASGRSKGFGFVEMSTDEEAQAAIEKFDGSDMDGRNIVVNVARPKEDRPRGGFGGGSRSFR